MSAPAILGAPRRAALIVVAVLVAAASLVSFAESYRGLFSWAHEHGLSGAWAAIWPLQVDVFIAVGELALFVALVDACSAGPGSPRGRSPWPDWPCRWRATSATSSATPVPTG